MVNGRQILIPVRQGVRTVVAEVMDTVQLVTVLMGVCFLFLDLYVLYYSLTLWSVSVLVLAMPL